MEEPEDTILELVDGTWHFNRQGMVNIEVTPEGTSTRVVLKHDGVTMKFGYVPTARHGVALGLLTGLEYALWRGLMHIGQDFNADLLRSEATAGILHLFVTPARGQTPRDAITIIGVVHGVHGWQASFMNAWQQEQRETPVDALRPVLAMLVEHGFLI